MFNSVGEPAGCGLHLLSCYRVWLGSQTEYFVEPRTSVNLTDAVFAFHFVPRGTDASEGPLQILTGTRRTRARESDTLISIFKEKQDKKMT